jgi:hypothetical protein
MLQPSWMNIITAFEENGLAPVALLSDERRLSSKAMIILMVPN